MAESTLKSNVAGYQELKKFSDAGLQAHLLHGVSRTFALTIPQLPPKLRHVVSNAYLLCRTIDTIEDEPALTISQKRSLGHLFVQVVGKNADPEDFVSKLYPLLSHHTIPAETELIHNTASVIRITHSLDKPQFKALQRCVKIMADGMVYFQEKPSGMGLADIHELNRYCYYVAGVVGEMLTDLFCDYSMDIARNRRQMMDLAVSFGQGLQMTNILKDIWDDQERSACWLPKDIFKAYGYNLEELGNGRDQDKFEKGLEHLIGIAHAHLNNAFKYVMLIPPYEKGIREFCLWALGMAILTLLKINNHKNFTRGEQVKISRRSVKATVIATRLTVSNNSMLKILYNLTRMGLPIQKL